MANIRTIDYGGFNHATGSAATGSGFMIWSGSMSLSKSDAYAAEDTQYYGVGIEAIADSASYLRFQTDIDGTGTSSLDIRTNQFILGSLGPGGSFISGSGNGTIAISSSNFELTEGGDVTMQGAITAEAGGTIGGWIIGSGSLSSSDNSINIRSGDDPRIKLTGETPLNFMQLYYGNDSDYGLVARQDNATTFALGRPGSFSTGNLIAGWTFTDTALTGGELVLNKEGSVKNTSYIPNQQGFALTAASGGFLEVENAKIRGTLSTAVFEKETVNAVGGQLYVANSTTLTGSVITGQANQGGLYAASDTTFSVVNVSGFTGSYGAAGGEILSLKKITDTGFSTEYVMVQSASRNTPSSGTDFSGLLYVSRSYGNNLTATGTSQSLGEIPGAAVPYSGSQVIVSTGRVGTGYIRLNANPNDSTTPYLDIVERTGSSVYAIDLKARLGDLSGITDTINGKDISGFGLYTDNAFLKGGIVATYGSIGGFGISDTAISSSNNNLILRSNGEITGSDVLFTSGKIASFTITGNQLNAPNFIIDGGEKRLTAGANDNVVILDGDDGISAGSASFLQAPFNVSRTGFVTAANLAGRMEVVNEDNSGSYIRHTNIDSASGDLVFDGSRGGLAIMNMIINIPSTFVIQDIIVPRTGSHHSDVFISIHNDAPNISFNNGISYPSWQELTEAVPSAYLNPLTGSGGD